MDIVYNVLVPIITSLLGGLIAGLFTFLGVKMTLTHERKTREEDLKMKQAEQRKQEIEKNIIRNKKIIQTRPELKTPLNDDDIKSVEEYCILPYENPTLIDENLILFKYSDEIFKDDFWNKYELILQNTGKRIIRDSFLHLPYKSFVNIYLKSDLLRCRGGNVPDYYCDESLLPSYIHPNEKIKIVIYYPKATPKLKNVGFDLYMRDEDDNYWYQPCVNSYDGESESQVIPDDTFYMHLKQDFNYWLMYDKLYYSEGVEKLFKENLSDFLAKRKNLTHAKVREQEGYAYKVKKGEITLNYKLPLE